MLAGMRSCGGKIWGQAHQSLKGANYGLSISNSCKSSGAEVSSQRPQSGYKTMLGPPAQKLEMLVTLRSNAIYREVDRTPRENSISVRKAVRSYLTNLSSKEASRSILSKKAEESIGSQQWAAARTETRSESKFSPLVVRKLHSNAALRRDRAAATTPPSTSGSGTANGKGFINWYLRQLEENPIVTKCITAGAIMVVADATSQILVLEGNLPPPTEFHQIFDYWQLGRMAAIGFFLWGPALHGWYGLMSRILPGTDMMSSVKKMALGQVSFGPAFTAVFFSINGFAVGESVEQVQTRLQRDLVPTLLKGLCYWPFCDILNFRFAPVRLQPLGNKVASLLWTVYITYVASGGKA